MINFDAMIANMNLPVLTSLEVDKRELFLKVFESAITIHNQPTERLQYQGIEALAEELEEWDELELVDFVHYLLSYITEHKVKNRIPKEIKLKLHLVVNNRVACIGSLEMCAKTTSEIYMLEMDMYTEKLETTLNEEDVIDYPTLEDLEKVDV